MKQNYSHIDKVFAQRLKGRKKAVPTQAWESIEHSLDKKKKPLLPLWAQWGAAAAILLLVFQLGYRWSEYTTHNATIVEAKFDNKGLPNKHKDATINTPNIQDNKPVKTIIKKSNKSNNTIHKSPKKLTSPKKIKVKIEKRSAEVPKRQESQINLNYLSSKKTTILFAYVNSPSIQSKTLELATLSPSIQKEEKIYSYTGTETKNKPIAFGVSAAPSYSYRKLSANTANGTSLTEYYDEQENGMNQYAAMAEMNYELNSRISVQVGLAYNTFGYQDTDALSYALKGHTYHLNEIENSSATYAVTEKEAYLSLTQISSLSLNRKGEEDLKTAILTQEFAYLQFPVSLGFSLLKSKNFNTKLLSGLSPGYMIKENSSLQYDGEDIPLQSIDSFNKKIISGLVGFAIQYEISNHIQFKLQPMLNYAFSSVVNNPDYNLQPYSWNVFGGIHYKIN
jgi:hypothetical protein